LKEDNLIDELKVFVLENINEFSLNGEAIGKQFGMSRMQVHRKIKSLTSLTTSEYIRTIRLERAAELLEDEELNVSEIAYKTGFSSPSHFSRVFKKKYGKAPSKY